MKPFTTLSVLTLLLCGSVTADDWPQWRGPNRDDISNEKGLLQQWPDGGPKSVWTYDKAGMGYAGFAVVGDHLYSQGLESGSAFAFCVNVKTGEKVWQTDVADHYRNGWGDGPRSTPTVDGDRVYCMFSKGTLACLNANSGDLIWKKDMLDFGGKIQNWGYTESVLVDGDKVVCTPGGRQGTMLALNKLNGETIWQSTEFTQPCQYPSIVKATIHGKPQYIQLTARQLAGVSAEDGKVLWSSEWNGSVAVIPTPIVQGNTVYISSGYGAGSKLVQVAQDWSATDVWSNKVMKNHHGGVIAVDGHLYGYSDRVGWTCQSMKTGEAVWSAKRELGKGAIGYADGRFYLVEEGSGTVVLIDASTDGYKERGRFTLSPQTKRRSPRGKIWVHPVIANGRLYLRDQEYVYCFDVSS